MAIVVSNAFKYIPTCLCAGCIHGPCIGWPTFKLDIRVITFVPRKKCEHYWHLGLRQLPLYSCWSTGLLIWIFCIWFSTGSYRKTNFCLQWMSPLSASYLWLNKRYLCISVTSIYNINGVRFVEYLNPGLKVCFSTSLESDR